MMTMAVSPALFNDDWLIATFFHCKMALFLAGAVLLFQLFKAGTRAVEQDFSAKFNRHLRWNAIH